MVLFRYPDRILIDEHHVMSSVTFYHTVSVDLLCTRLMTNGCFLLWCGCCIDLLGPFLLHLSPLALSVFNYAFYTSCEYDLHLTCVCFRLSSYFEGNLLLFIRAGLLIAISRHTKLLVRNYVTAPRLLGQFTRRVLLFALGAAYVEIPPIRPDMTTTPHLVLSLAAPMQYPTVAALNSPSANINTSRRCPTRGPFLQSLSNHVHLWPLI